MTHEEHRETLALVALGEDVGAGRAEALEVHLAACGDCRAELRALSDAAAALALASPPVAPSPELRSRVLAAIKTTPQERATPGVAAPTPGGSDEATAAKATTGGQAAASNVVPFDAGRCEGPRARGISRTTLLVGSLAASLAIAALSVSLFMLYLRNNQLRSDIARLSAQLEETRSQLGETRTEMARVRGEAEVLAAPDSLVALMTGTEVATNARARLVFSEATGEAVLVAANLPQPPAGKAYQLWYIAGGKPLPGSVFRTDAAGRGRLRENIPPEGRRAALFAVTLEPAGGVPAPTGDMYLKGPAS
jgi:hypothetical protein